jgi:hypothetical protein
LPSDINYVPHKVQRSFYEAETVFVVCLLSGFFAVSLNVKVKGKWYPITGHEDPEDSGVIALLFL